VPDEDLCLSLSGNLCAASLFAEETPESIAKSELPSLFAIYKDMHQHPERSTHEQRTSEPIAKELESRDGLVGLVRPDMDALPKEETGLRWARERAYRINDIQKGAPSWSVAPNSASTCLLVE